MLILVRKVQQGIWIEGDIWVKVLSVDRDRVKLGITAPDTVKVMRQELCVDIENAGEFTNGRSHPENVPSEMRGAEEPS
ncbi:MAG: carbon storage regulator [Dehalococcoidia bacterium]